MAALLSSYVAVYFSTAVGVCENPFISEKVATMFMATVASLGFFLVSVVIERVRHAGMDALPYDLMPSGKETASVIFAVPETPTFKELSTTQSFSAMLQTLSMSLKKRQRPRNWRSLWCYHLLLYPV